MTGLTYTIFAYVISLALLWGYAASLWLNWRALNRRSE
jgi:hypothetical protein